MLLQHVFQVHLVDVVPAENSDIIGIKMLDQVEVLIHRVGGAPVPGRTQFLIKAHLRGHNSHKVFGQYGPEAPRLGDVFGEALGLVLREDIHGENAGIDQVIDGKINDVVLAAKGHRRFGALGRQRREP